MTPPASSFRTTLITPAIASEPYCDAAPSRNTSIRLMAWTGMARRSVPVVPCPTAASSYLPQIDLPESRDLLGTVDVHRDRQGGGVDDSRP